MRVTPTGETLAFLETEPSGFAGMEDRALVDLACAGNGDAFGALVDRHYDFIFGVAHKWCGSVTDAEDIAQDVCVKLARVLSGFDGRAKFSTWLYRITLNCVRDMQRARQRSGKRDSAFADVSATSAAPDQDDAVALNELWQAVRKLPDKQRDAVLLVFAEDRTHAEAAAVMDVKESTISWYVHEAKKTLKGLL